ncbi:MAG: ABC transporter permease subunit [Planctomycetota bacterium]
MIAFLTRRLVWVVLTLWIVFTISFVLMRSVPGTPWQDERNLPPEVEAELREQYRLEISFENYWSVLGDCLSGDLGPSYRLLDFRVAEIIAQGLPKSALLGVVALAFAVLIGVTAGAVAAARRGHFLDTLLMSGANLGISLPNFVIAGVLVVIVCFRWQLLPPAGWGGLRELLLPAFCLGAPFAASIARLTRTGVLEVLSQDYIRTAHAKGVHPRVVVSRHALRLALLPVVSFLGPATAGILTGSLVIERIFAIPGIGSHFVQAALSRDYTLSMGVVLLYTLLVSLMNLFVDISYRVLDPRVRAW